MADNLDILAHIDRRFDSVEQSYNSRMDRMEAHFKNELSPLKKEMADMKRDRVFVRAVRHSVIIFAGVIFAVWQGGSPKTMMETFKAYVQTSDY